MAWMKLNTHCIFRVFYLYNALPNVLERLTAKLHSVSVSMKLLSVSALSLRVKY